MANGLPKKEKNAKKGGGKFLFFYKADVLLYAIVIAVIFLLFVFFVIIPRLNYYDGVTVSYKNREIISINVKDGSFILTESEGVNIKTENGENETLFYVYLGEEKKDYNVISFNKSEKTVSVIDADCSLRKDCVHTSPIKDGKGVIICAPHELKIIATKSGNIPVTTG